MYILEAALTHQINSALLHSLQHAEEPQNFNERPEFSLGQICIAKLRLQLISNQ